MARLYVLDHEGKPLPLEDGPENSLMWAEWFATADRIVAKDVIIQGPGLQPIPDSNLGEVVLQTCEEESGGTSGLESGGAVVDPMMHQGEATVYVSTVFLGINHNFMGECPPVLWETMVFGGSMNGFMARYDNLEDALVGHRSVVSTCRLAAEVDSVSR